MGKTIKYKVYYAPYTVAELKDNKKLTLMDEDKVIASKKDTEKYWKDEMGIMPEGIIQAMLPPKGLISEANLSRITTAVGDMYKLRKQFLCMTWKYFLDLRKDCRNALLHEARCVLMMTDTPLIIEIRLHAFFAILHLFKLRFSDGFKNVEEIAKTSLETESAGNTVLTLQEQIRERLEKLGIQLLLPLESSDKRMVKEAMGERNIIPLPNGQTIEVFFLPTKYGLRGVFRARHYGMCSRYSTKRVPYVFNDHKQDGNEIVKALELKTDAKTLSLCEELYGFLKQTMPNLCEELTDLNKHIHQVFGITGIPWFQKETPDDFTQPFDPIISLLGKTLCTTMAVNFLCRSYSHLDSQDKSDGMCIVMPVGEFTEGELVLVNCGYQLQLEKGQPAFFRSSFITHFNRPFKGTRHSIVLYSDRNVFAWKNGAEYTDEEKKAALMTEEEEKEGSEVIIGKMPVDNEDHIEKLQQLFKPSKNECKSTKRKKGGGQPMQSGGGGPRA
ncbi:hypothetical protein HDU96_006297 [Phlyctochytrium bullatum]|nr:hypothetical protein HDU96_006297 [Phlyctochytrium bullatum]